MLVRPRARGVFARSRAEVLAELALLDEALDGDRGPLLVHAQDGANTALYTHTCAGLANWSQAVEAAPQLPTNRIGLFTIWCIWAYVNCIVNHIIVIIILDR